MVMAAVEGKREKREKAGKGAKQAGAELNGQHGYNAYNGSNGHATLTAGDVALLDEVAAVDEAAPIAPVVPVAALHSVESEEKKGTGAPSRPLPTINFALLKELSETPGVAGREERVREVVIRELTPLVDELSVDTLGNVIAIKHGRAGKAGKSVRAPRIMLDAHMDEIGFMARYIDERGFIRIQPLGGFDPRVLTAQRVIVHTRSGEHLHGALMPASKPIHLIMLSGEKPGAPVIEDFYVDLGMPAERVRELVSLGDSITLDRSCERVGDNVIGKAMDDRSGVFTMIEALRKLGKSKHEATIYAVATVQEEVGLRGATTAGYQVEPDVVIALDTTLAVDTPGMPDTEAITRLGKGAAIKVFDSSFIP